MYFKSWAKNKYHAKPQKKHCCKFCGIWFTPQHHGLNTPKYCSWDCANKGTAEHRKMVAERKRNQRPKQKRICVECGKEYERPIKYSLSQWQTKKFCSSKCAIEHRRIKDGMTNHERRRRRMGKPKKGTPECIEKIRAKTSEAMHRPEINAKLHKSRSPQSIETRIKHSNALAGKLPKNMMFNGSNYPNVQRGDYDNSKGTMYFRSKWEANYALFLDYLVEKSEIKNWEYEVDVFVFEEVKFGTRSYRPDFKVFNQDGSFEYHEVKGYMDSKSKTKLKRMAKYYPEIKLILIDGKYYYDLNKKLGRLLNFY